LNIRILIFALAVAAFSGCSAFSTPRSIDERVSELEVQQTDPGAQTVSRRGSSSGTLRLLSLNMAHGRKDSFSQIFVGEAEIRRNLADIVELLKRENADIVTLQEADAASSWSGNFDHVEFLARESGYAWYAHANHVENRFASYGTAVLSRFPIAASYRIDFNPTPPTTRKGFTLAEIEWEDGSDNGEKRVIDVVSVHLDFSRRSKRILQIQDLKEVLGRRQNPGVVLGDFNSTWIEGDRELQDLARSGELKTHRPEANHLYTYSEERFDWILISKEFEFCDYYTVDDVVSDHRAVISEIVPVNVNPSMAVCSPEVIPAQAGIFVNHGAL
jgi:endonuclease/exonuclease/phosphatase family metal-dependent hydrolase